MAGCFGLIDSIDHPDDVPSRRLWHGSDIGQGCQEAQSLEAGNGRVGLFHLHPMPRTSHTCNDHTTTFSI
jgi:hypothetical protein